MAELVDLARHRDLHDEALGGVGVIGEQPARPGEPRVQRGHLPGRSAVHEEPVDRGQEVVAGGAGNRPPVGQGLARTQDLLGRDPERPGVRGGRLLEGAGAVERAERLRLRGAQLGHEAPRGRHQRAFLETAEVLARRVEPVGMVHAQRGHLALAHEPDDQLVGRVEHDALLHADGGQVAHVEEPAVVHLVARHAPVREPVGLGREQAVERVEARRIPRRRRSRRAPSPRCARGSRPTPSRARRDAA